MAGFVTLELLSKGVKKVEIQIRVSVIRSPYDITTCLGIILGDGQSRDKSIKQKECASVRLQGEQGQV